MRLPVTVTTPPLVLLIMLLGSCSFDPEGLPDPSVERCGNGIVEGDEACDTTAIPGSCQALGYSHGSLGCTSGCSFDTTLCSDACGECTPGEERCTGTIATRCTTESDGCGAWIVTEDCSLTEQFCALSGGETTCVDQCEDQCSLGATRCHDGDSVDECVMVTINSGSCLQWTASEQCASGYACAQTVAGASCDATCENECDQGESRCTADATGVETCTLASTGCTIWSLSTICSGGETCTAVSAAEAVCGICEVCTIDDIQCSPDGGSVQECQPLGPSCTEWGDTKPCDGDTICRDEGGSVDCHPCHPCVNGERRCAPDGASIQTCQSDASGCNSWYSSEACDAAPLMGCLDDGSGPLCDILGDSCAEANPIQLPYHLELPDLSAYSDTQTYNDMGCGFNYNATSDLYLSVLLAEGQRIHYYETGSMTANLMIHNTCSNTNCLAADAAGNEIIFDVPADGTYIFILEEEYNGAGTVSLHIEEVPSLCTHNETEPNNTPAQANAFWALPDYFCHTLPMGTDKDCLRFAVPPGGASLNAETLSAFMGTACPGDTYLQLYTLYGAEIFTDDDDGDGYCSLMAHATDQQIRYLAPGEYVLCDRTYYDHEIIAEKVATHVTLDAPAWDLLLHEDFEAAPFPPAGWTTANSGVTSTAGWARVTSTTPPNARAQVLTSYDETGVEYALRTFSLDLSGYTGGILQLMSEHNCGTYNTPRIFYTTDGWSSRAELWSTTTGVSSQGQMQISLPSGIMGMSDVQFAFVADDAYAYASCQWSLDDILIAAW